MIQFFTIFASVA